jgi:hypothetical protein
MKRVHSAVLLAVLGGALLYFQGCGNPTKPDESEKKPSEGGSLDNGGPAPWEPIYSCPGTSGNGLDTLGKDYVVIKYNNGAAPTVTYSDGASDKCDLDISGEHVVLKASYYYGSNSILLNIIVSGKTANGSLRIEDLTTGYRKALYLDGVDITNPTGPAINIQSKATDVYLSSCGNKLADGPVYTELPIQTKGTFFSEKSLTFSGDGSLEVRSKAKHAIVSDENIEVTGGNIFIHESKGDGIHANNKITVTGGNVQIKCEGDAIQNERGRSPITIAGGEVKIRTTGAKGHGIASDSSDVFINDSVGRPDINITLTGNGSKGIRSRGGVTIDGGGVYLEAYGRRESLANDTSSAAGIKTDGNVTVKKGTITVKTVRNNENGKGFNVDGDVTVSGGTTDISADGDGVRVRGTFTITGGTFKSNSAHKKDIDCDGALNNNGGTLSAPNTNK